MPKSYNSINMKDKKSLSISITEVILNKLGESGEQSKTVAKAVTKSAENLAKKISKLSLKAEKKLKKAKKKAKAVKKDAVSAVAV